MSYKPIATYGPLAAAADNATVFELLGNAEGYDTYQLGSTTGAMDVFSSGDGITFLAAPLGLVDLATGLTVSATVAGGHYSFRGRYKALRVLQQGATAVANAYVIAGVSRAARRAPAAGGSVPETESLNFSVPAYSGYLALISIGGM